MAFRHCLHTSQPDANNKMEIIMITNNLKSSAWFAIGMAVFVASSNLAFADSLTSQNKQTSYWADIAPEATQSKVASVQCGDGSGSACPAEGAQLPIQLDKTEIERLLKFGGPH
jgi:hypothetical protein